MKLGINLIYPTSVVIFIILLHLQFSSARNLANATKVLANKELTAEAMKSNSTNKQQNVTTLNSSKSQRINDTTAITTLSIQTKLSEESELKTSTVITHIVRKKREFEVTMPYDFNTMHMPCELDAVNRPYIIFFFPNHCIWVVNNRHSHEGFYRVYKMYQLEAHLFGQYYERLKRYEIDPHFFEYK
ncbi:uncharacterized protein LOC117785052 [Drosophila innubila]|uniref:uncharacterized protein LOC117785052 n=1 Tax=Drosophila innubila TaxID=198719 RepID=UPI00148C307D|nr:uncharacterized protein LOC117785052 [Drosophila innubila]